MVSRNDAVIIGKSNIPAGKVVGTFTFLREMGKTLAKDKAILINTMDADEAKKIQNRWRAYFKGTGRSRRKITDDGKIIVYLWKD